MDKRRLNSCFWPPLVISRVAMYRVLEATSRRRVASARQMVDLRTSRYAPIADAHDGIRPEALVTCLYLSVVRVARVLAQAQLLGLLSSRLPPPVSETPEPTLADMYPGTTAAPTGTLPP